MWRKKKKPILFLTVPLQGVKKEEREDVLNSIRVRTDNELQRIGRKPDFDVVVIQDVGVVEVK